MVERAPKMWEFNFSGQFISIEAAKWAHNWNRKVESLKEVLVAVGNVWIVQVWVKGEMLSNCVKTKYYTKPDAKCTFVWQIII